MRFFRLRVAGLALVLWAALGGIAGVTAAASGAATVSGVLRDRASGAPLPGVIVRLGPGHRAATDARGRFRFPGVATGIYRVIVTGSCDEVPLRVDVRPGEDQEIAVQVDRSCAEAARIGEPEAPAPDVERKPWRAMLVARDRIGIPNWCLADGDAVWDLSRPGPTGTAVVASLDLSRCDLETLAPGAAPAPAGGDWIALRQEGCFAPWSQQFTVTAGGELRVQLIPNWGVREGMPVLRRNLCAGCVETLFRDLRALDLPALTGAFESQAPFGPYCALGGVIGGKPFLVRTSRLRLAPLEAARTRLLDLCAYRSCVDPGARTPIPVSITIDAPAEVRAGERFTVRARATVPPGVDVSGAAVSLDVAARYMSGEGAVSGMLDAGSPLVVEAQYEAPARAWNGQGTIEVNARFAAENAVPADPACYRVTRTIRVRER